MTRLEWSHEHGGYGEWYDLVEPGKPTETKPIATVDTGAHSGRWTVMLPGRHPVPLEARTEKEAKAEALAMVRARLVELTEAVDAVG